MERRCVRSDHGHEKTIVPVAMRRPSFPTFARWPALLLLPIAAAAPAAAEEATEAVAPPAAVEAARPSAAVVERAQEAETPGPGLDAGGRETLLPSPLPPAAPSPGLSPSRASKRWSTSAEVDSTSYRVSLARGKLDMGVGFDAPTHPAMATSTTVRSTDPSRPIVPTLPTLSVGVRSTTAGSTPNSLIERATDAATPAASTRRVGLEWKPVPSRVFIRGGLGLRLSGDDQVTMKIRSGRIGIYMKSTF
jgi:hypothetical protein